MVFYTAREVLRNSAKHRRGVSPLEVRISAKYESGLEIVIEDSGAGGKAEGGSGLALHGTMLAVVGGELELATNTEGGSKVKLRM